MTGSAPSGPLLPSAGVPGRLTLPTPSVAKEVLSGESYMGRDMLQTSVQAGWLPTHGPWVAGYLGMYRAFSVHMGLTREAVEVQSGKTSTTEAGDFAVAWGFNFASLAFNGWQANAGLFYVGLKYMRVHASLAMPLNSHWLPKRVADLRVRVHYMTAGDHDTPAGLGLGLEWGAW